MKIPLFGGHAIRIESPVKWMKDWYGMIHPKPDVWKLVVEEIKASLVKKAPTHRSSFPWIGQNVLVARLHDYVIKGLEKCSPIGRSKPESEMKPFGFTIAINRAMYCRWELALLLAHWPSTDKARRKLIDEAFKRTDALLGHLADILDAAEPGSLRQFVWPTDCVLRGLSDTDSNSCRTAFQFLSDTVLIHFGQWYRLMSDSFGASLDWCPTGLERCPIWFSLMSDQDWNPGPGGVERRWKGCQGSGSIQMNRERHLMARTKLNMRQIQEILRLKHQNQLSIREIARSCGLPTSTIGDYLKRAAAAGISWPLPEGQSEKELLQLLIAHPAAEPALGLALPDWPYIHKELGRKRVTLFLLWQEYSKGQPEGYCYSRFCQLYRRWAGTLDPVLRQVHLPGEKMFVDWAGQTVEIHSAQDGSVSEGHLFVAVLGASNKTYAEAFENEKLAAWIEAHCHAYAFFQGVARITVPDNLKTGVIRPCRYEPMLHRSYQEMAEHYGTVIIPGRIKKPRDKAKVEGAVLIAERQILAALRDQRFFHVGQLNAAIIPLLTKLNEQPFQKLEGSRNSWFETLEKDRLLPLPATAFELAAWSTAKVNIDYHVVVENHFYSAPYQLIHQPLDVRLTEKTVELFKHGKRVAAHRRSSQSGRFTTDEQHRPKSHQRYLEWTPSRILEWVKTIGPECVKVVEKIMADRPHPEQGFRSALGIIRLGKAVGHDRLEAACRRALHFGTCSYTSLNSILQNNLETRPLEQELPLPSPVHENLRGSPYYS